MKFGTRLRSRILRMRSVTVCSPSTDQRLVIVIAHCNPTTCTMSNPSQGRYVLTFSNGVSIYGCHSTASVLSCCAAIEGLG